MEARFKTGAFAVALVAGAISVSARADTILSVDRLSSTASYTVVHPLHTVVATSKQVEGKVQIASDGTVFVRVIVPVASFVSGSSGRDEHMQETLDVATYPNVTFKGHAKITVPTSFPSTMTVSVKGVLDFHGHEEEETVPVKVTFNSPTTAHTTSEFIVSLGKYKVDRPSLLLMKIHDDCKLDLDLALKQ